MDAYTLFGLTERNFMMGQEEWMPREHIDRDGEERRVCWPKKTTVYESETPETILLEKEEKEEELHRLQVIIDCKKEA